VSSVAPGWVPDRASLPDTRIVRFAEWLVAHGRADLADVTDYAELQAWSARHPGAFWGSVADFFEVEWSEPPRVALAERLMPGAVWFPGGSLNFAQHLLRHGADEHEAVVLVTEAGERSSLTFGRLRAQVAAVAGRLRELGVGPGDRVVGYLPNSLEGVVAFTAVALIGAVWAQAGLDYAPAAAADRLGQLAPKVLVAGSGYRFGGSAHDRRAEVGELRDLLPGLEHTITVATGGVPAVTADPGSSSWAAALAAAPDGRATPAAPGAPHRARARSPWACPWCRT